MTVPEFTREQLDAIGRRGELLVSANAGSGKTSVMVESFVRSALDDGVAVDAILALTFTEKAAAQLRDRIRGRFAELGEEAHARATETAHISTIHGFCARVLRAHALVAGLDPLVSVLDDPAADRAMRAAFDRALADFVERRRDDALQLAAGYGTAELRELCSALYRRLRSEGASEPRLPPPPPPTPLAPLQDELRAALDAAAAFLGGADERKMISAALKKLATGAVSLPSQPDQPARLSDLESMRIGAGAKALNEPPCIAYREALEAYLAACVNHLATPAYELIGELLERFGERYRQHKRATSALDFDDLELGVRDLFAARPEIADSYGERFARVMVDEFQDTNPRQMEIIDRIAHGNLSVVGDEFQSIYAFRHADVELFRRRRAALSASDDVLSLTTNYRADERILDAINAAFAPRFGPDFLALRAGLAPIAADGPLVELLLTDQEGWEGTDEEPIDLGERLPGSIRWRLAEARMLAHRLRDLIDTTGYGYGDVVVLLRATGDMALFERALEERDIPTYVIGARGYWRHRQVQDLVAWLSVLANPGDELRAYEVLVSPLCGVSSDALALVATTGEQLGRAAWWTLREAVFGDGSHGLLERLGESDRPRVTRLVELVERERAMAPRVALEALIERAISETGYDLAVLAMPGGRRRLANVRKLMRLAREYERDSGRDLRGFLDLIAELAEDRWGGDRENEAPIESEAPAEGDTVDAVRIMTIHRAKGLEFPVVCVADLGRDTPTRGRDRLRLDRDAARGRVGLRLRTLDGPDADAFDYAELADDEAKLGFAEEQRLFYVAVTRARQRLILSGAVRLSKWPEEKETGCPPVAWLAPAFAPDLPSKLTADEPEYVQQLSWNGRTTQARCVLNSPATIGITLPPEVLAPKLVGRGVASRGGTAGEAGGGAEPPEAATGPRGGDAPGLPSQTSYSALEGYARCGYRYYLENVLRLPQEHVAPGEGGLPALLRGTIVHELLERVDFGAPDGPSPDEIAELASAHGATLSGADARGLAELVESFLASELCARLATAGDVRREERFGFMLDVGDGRELLVTGAVDAIARDHERVTIVDYKTDRLDGREPSEVVEEAYATQRLVYALAALRDGATEVEVVHCFLERPDALAIGRFTRADAERLAADLTSRAAGLVAGEFAVSPEPHRALCQSCPGRVALCSWEQDMTMRDSPVGAP